MMIPNGSLIQEGGLSILEYFLYPNGEKGYQVTWKTAKFTHISYLVHVPVEHQSKDKLLDAAKNRVNFVGRGYKQWA